VNLLSATPASALAIGAHPDDIEFQCGATLARWAADGCAVHHLVLTDGSKGTWDPEADLADLVRARQIEQRAAAAALGATGEVRFLGHVDGELDSTLATRGEVARVIRELRPAVVLGHDPWKRYRLHPDHRHAGWLAVDGAVAARDPHFFADHGLPHHRPEALLLFEAEKPDRLVDATGFVDTKVAALLEHRSQLVTTMGIDPGDDGSQRAAFARRIHDDLAETGTSAGLEAAEAFRHLAL
jgi:LmbE family N-acetylglucosaminyl deacetylase